MSKIPYTVLISSAGTGPFRTRELAPISVASLWVGGSASWTFTSLLDGAAGSIRPADAESEAAALLVGIAVHLVRDESVSSLWAVREQTRSGAPVHRGRDGELVSAARKVVESVCRLSVVGESLSAEATALPTGWEELRGLDVEVLVPVPA